jgi:hypothetical protein
VRVVRSDKITLSSLVVLDLDTTWHRLCCFCGEALCELGMISWTIHDDKEWAFANHRLTCHQCLYRALCVGGSTTLVGFQTRRQVRAMWTFAVTSDCKSET